jgi:WD40 repeat protein
VGTLEGASVIYDVRTATRSVVLEGHIGPVVVLAFSPDAKLIATCSLVDQSVRVWHTNLSLFGIITSSISHGLGSHQPKPTSSTSESTKETSGSQKPHKTFSFAMPDSKCEVSFFFFIVIYSLFAFHRFIRPYRYYQAGAL